MEFDLKLRYTEKWPATATEILNLVGGLSKLASVGARMVNVDESGIDFFFSEAKSGANYVRLLRDGPGLNHALFYHIDPSTHTPKIITSRSNLCDSAFREYIADEIGF